MEVISTEFKNLKDLINASKTISGTVVGYRYGEIRVYENIAYIVSSLSMGVWYVIFTRNTSPIKEDTEALEFTVSNEIKEINIEQFGQDPKSLYFLIIKPASDDIVNTLLKKIKSE